MTVTRRFRADLFTCCLAIFIAGLLGLVQGVVATNTPAGKGAVRAARSVQPQAAAKANATKGTGDAGRCGDKSKRYNDCGNGTITDTVTGLIWLKQSDCLPASNWEGAKKATADLKNGTCMLTDGSAAGDWRLPTSAEWEATMKNAKAMGCSGPMLTNDAGNACISAGPSSFMGVEADYYWSSTPLEGNMRIYFGDLDHGNILNGVPTNSLRIWPVRGGQR